MPALVLLGVVGFCAQLVNTALGMGYGVSSTTFLLSLGTTPVLASATVNFSQVGSQLVSGVAHWRFGNVDWRLARRLGLPGALGAFSGAMLLTWLSTEAARPLMAAILLGLGGYILVRFTVRGTPRRGDRPPRSRFLAPLGLVGGFLNSTGGGGSGPVMTTALLVSGRVEPRKAIGSISVAEFAVVVAGSSGFLLGLGLGGVHLPWVLVMLCGGVLAAPLGAALARHIPARMLGSLVGGLIVVINVRNLLAAGAAPAAVQVAALAVLAVVWAGAVAWSAAAHRAERRAAPAPAAPATVTAPR